MGSGNFQTRPSILKIVARHRHGLYLFKSFYKIEGRISIYSLDELALHIECSPGLMWLTVLTLVVALAEGFEDSWEDSDLEKILRHSCKHQKYQVKVEVEHQVATVTIEWSIVDIINNVVPLEQDGTRQG